jgi:hypothetical protein
MSNEPAGFSRLIGPDVSSGATPLALIAFCTPPNAVRREEPMISLAMGSALAAQAGNVGAPIAPALVAAGSVLAPIGWGLVIFVVVVLGALLGAAYDGHRPRHDVARIPNRHPFARARPPAGALAASA